jgi:hypothetical protein
MPRLYLRPPGGLLALLLVGLSSRRLDRTPLQVRNFRLERLGGLAAELGHPLGLGWFGRLGPNPLKASEESLHLGPPIVLIRLKRHFHRRFAVAAPVLDLRRVGHRLDEGLDVFPAAAAGHVSNVSHGRPNGVPVKAGDDRRMGKALGDELGVFLLPLADRHVAAPLGVSKVPEPSGFFRGVAALSVVAVFGTAFHHVNPAAG